MSRGGRGARGGRGGFGGSSNMPPMGLTFADIQNLSREATALYPPRRVPVLTEYSSDEKRVAELQIGFADRLRKSEYYVVERVKSTELPRYSDKYRPSAFERPKLKRSDLNPEFFPPELFEGYFNLRKKSKREQRKASKLFLNLDELGDEEEEDKSPEERSENGSEEAQPDYDEEDDNDNDYAENYFDNGEGDDLDDLGGGGGGDEGGGADYD